MKIVMLTANDPAGMGIAFTRAINAYTPHTCRLVTTATRYNFEFATDLHIPDLTATDFDIVAGLLEAADIFHFHILSDENLRLGPLRVKDYMRGKAVLHHHHGHPDFQADPRPYRDKYRRLGRRAIVSTPDLTRLLPEAAWVPNLVPINAALYRPQAKTTPAATIRVGHSPTRRDLKKTDLFEQVMAGIQNRHRNVHSVIISDSLHSECLRIKGGCDIFFDQLGPSFGVSSLEALSQGLPTIARLDRLNVELITEFSGSTQHPWINVADQADLARAIENLVTDTPGRRAKGAAARVFMEQCWHEERILGRLMEIYGSL